MRSSLSLFILLWLSSIVLGSINEREEARIVMEQFKANHPQAVFFGQQYFDSEGFFEQVGPADFVFGAPMSKGETPMESAWDFYQQIEGAYVEEAGTLVPGDEQGVMWDQKTESYKFTTFRFQQTIKGIPVYRSGIGFLVRNEDNFPVVMSSNNLKELRGFDVAAGANAKVTDAMLANVMPILENAGPARGIPREGSVLEVGGEQKRLQPIQMPIVCSDEQLVIFAGVTNVREEPRAALVFTATRGVTNDLTQYQKHLVVASLDDGEVLHSENMVHADVSGTVSGRATNDNRALECAPEAEFALPYAQVREVGTSNFTFTDVDGNFTLPASGNGTFLARSLLFGKYFRVFDNATNVNNEATPFVDITTTANGTIDFLHNPNDTEFTTANVNCYLRANILRDFVLSFEPNFPVIRTQSAFRILTNQTAIGAITSCNAVYTGDSIIFMRNLGQCNNTAISSVIYHEYGHHLVESTGNDQGQFGEGASDTIAVLIEDDPILGRGFFEDDCSSRVRTANAFRTYPCPSPFSAPHDCGQLLSGAVWDTLNEIRAVDPANARDITTSLFLGMLIVRGNMGGSEMIGPEVANIFVALDDDDAFFANGTPHLDQLVAGFNRHNLIIRSPNAGPITVNGTAAADDIVVSVVGDEIVVNVNDVQTGSFATVDVTRVDIFGLAGPDNIEVNGLINTFICGGLGSDTIIGGDLRNEIEGGGGNDTILGGPSIDDITGGAGFDIIDGGAGNDIIDGGTFDDMLFGGSGDDIIRGGDGADMINGGGGDDTLLGQDGPDLLLGSSGSDFAIGGEGRDEIFGGGGVDFLGGSEGNDVVNGGPGVDFVLGGVGQDMLFGGAGTDLMDGNGGADELFGGNGDDFMLGGTGNDVMRGGSGSDFVMGQEGADTLVGGPGNDELDGAEANDTFTGGPGNDTFIGGPGFDTGVDVGETEEGIENSAG